MKVLIAWSGSGREPYMHRGGKRVPGAHLQLLTESQYKGTFDLHYLLCVRETIDDALQLQRELSSASPPTRTEIRVAHLLDPTDHDEIARELGRILAEIDKQDGLFQHQLYVMLNTGTPQMQTVWVLLITSGLLEAKLIQTSPLELGDRSGTPPAREITLSPDAWREAYAPIIEAQRKLEG